MRETGWERSLERCYDSGWDGGCLELERDPGLTSSPLASPAL